jgi:hypothetical protein
MTDNNYENEEVDPALKFS